jgi:hypothetical protein
MENPVTYSLTLSNQNSEEYYQRIRELTDEIIEYASKNLTNNVIDFTDFLREFNLEKIRSDEEYYLELLSFGLLWKTYGKIALSIRTAPFLTLSRMAEWRKHHRNLKPAIDLARGVLVTLFLLPKINLRIVESNPSLHDIDRLCLWLEATGEFKEQALRFIRWRAYWETMSEERWVKGCKDVFKFVDWFTARAKDVIGKYTEKVEEFLAESGNRYIWREDRVQCSRTRNEYHLNMVGAEIMNRAFRKDFLNTEMKALLVPGCMRSNIEKCKAIRIREGLRCEGCDPKCNVNKLREMGKRNDYEIFIIPHASDLTLWSPQPNKPKRGVIAVACVTTLVEGGWELKRYDACAQCVLLDFSGCKKHWHREGIQTFINIKELKRILENKSNKSK